MNKSLLQLLLPLGMGVGGVLGNLLWVNSYVRTKTVVGINQQVVAGAEIPESYFMPIELPAQLVSQRSDLITWENKGLATRTPAARHLEPNTLVFMSDLALERKPPLNEYNLQTISLEPSMGYVAEQLRPGVQVNLVVAREQGEGEESFSLGPFEVFSGPLDHARTDTSSNQPNALSLLIKKSEYGSSDSQGERLRRAIANHLIRSIDPGQ